MQCYRRRLTHTHVLTNITSATIGGDAGTPVNLNHLLVIIQTIQQLLSILSDIQTMCAKLYFSL